MDIAVFTLVAIIFPLVIPLVALHIMALGYTVVNKKI